MRVLLPILTLLLAPALLGGCVRRVVDITSAPSGALVWMNGREVGTTPVEVEIVYYGNYDVQLTREGCEPLSTSAKANPPVWDAPGFDLVAEVVPANLVSRTSWHFELEPDDRDASALLERAEAAKARMNSEASQDGAASED
ncbi:MAG: PEGA domain-containing protein [Phycisphaerales bacterium]|nr:PEGA domain-containing protein [Phycisphaerales bacterium]